MIMSFAPLLRWWKHSETPQAPADAAAEKVSRPAEPPWIHQRDLAGIPRTLNYPSTTLARLLDQTADRFGEVTALIYNNKKWTYRELLEQVNRAAAGLANLGVRKGERVLMTLPNCPESVICFFAVQKLGALLVNAGPLIGQDDLRDVIAMTAPRVAIGLDLLAPALTQAAHGSTIEHFVWASLQLYQNVIKRVGYHVKLWQNRGSNGDGMEHIPLTTLLASSPSRPPSIAPTPSQTAILQPTGGTTGGIKLAQLSHAALLANATQVCTWMSCRPGQERVLTVLPTFHVYGLMMGLIAPVLSAATMIVTTRFDARATLELIRKYHPTIFPTVPAICDALCNLLERDDERRPFEGMRLCFSGAAPLPQEAAERFTHLSGVQIVEGYGLTEASPVTHACPANQPPRPRSIGLPMPDTQVRIVDLDGHDQDMPPGQPGELLVAGPQLMAGYFSNPEQTARVLTTDAHGTVWLHTGDVVRYDADGYFYVMDRMKDMIIRSGVKVYPARVEKVLMGHKGIADVAVVGRDDPVHTQKVVAVIVPSIKPEHPAQFETELRAYCREHLAPYEVPAIFEIVEKLPRSALGKLLKKDLRQGPAPTKTSPDDTPEPTPTPSSPHRRKEAA